MFAFFSLGFVLSFSSCKKLNEPTELGDELLPAVDNVNTFEANFDVSTSYYPFADTTKTFPTDRLALGQISDPNFGTTRADMYFNLSSTVYGSSGKSPFYNKASVSIDSVVLSLSYAGVYGDSTANVNVEVSEIASDNNGFSDTALYRFDHPGFTITGATLGAKSFSSSGFKDSVNIIRNSDTSKIANVLRIRLDNSLGVKLSQFDTAAGGPLANDTLFRAAFRGLAVKATGASGSGALAYFDLSSAGSILYVYYKSKKTDGTDTASTAAFFHSSYSATTGNKNYGVANSIVRTPAGEYLANLGKASSDQLYIQSSPSGSYANIRVPALDTFPNKVIHRAELIAYKLPTLQENFFGVPNQLLLDHRGTTTDTAFIFDNDIAIDYASGSVSLGSFGGTLKNNSYRFNITRYVQGVVTRKNSNDTLRLYAPLRSILFAKTGSVYLSVPVLSSIAYGRVAVAGGSYPDPALRMHLRVVYSNL